MAGRFRCRRRSLLFARTRPPTEGRWLGSGVRPATGRWPLVSSRTEVAYQRPGIIGRQPGGADVCEELPRHQCLDPDGQPGGCELREQDGRSPQCCSVSACAGSLDMVPGSQHHSLCRVRAGEPERRSGFLVTESQFSGVGAAPSGIRSDPVTLSPQRGGFVRHPPQRASTLRQLAARALIRRYRCFHSRLGRGRRLRVSTFRLVGQVPATGLPTESAVIDASDTPLAGGTLVSSSSRRSGGRTIPSPAVDRPSGGARRRATSLGLRAPVAIGRVAHLRRHFADQGFSQEVSALLLNSWRPTSARHYDSAWTQWDRWCRGRAVNPLRPRITNILEFLTSQFQAEKAYRTMAGYRSALSSTLPPLEGVSVGQHPLVCRLMKGVYHQRPPLPRYAATWDVERVLELLQTWHPPGQLSVERLTWKLTMLLALAGAKRTVELRNLSATGCTLSSNGATLTVGVPTKTQRTGSALKRVTFPCFHDPRLCPVGYLEAYLCRSASWRSESEHPQLLRSTRRPMGQCPPVRWLGGFCAFLRMQASTPRCSRRILRGVQQLPRRHGQAALWRLSSQQRTGGAHQRFTGFINVSKQLRCTLASFRECPQLSGWCSLRARVAGLPLGGAAFLDYILQSRFSLFCWYISLFGLKSQCLVLFEAVLTSLQSVSSMPSARASYVPFISLWFAVC